MNHSIIEAAVVHVHLVKSIEKHVIRSNMFYKDSVYEACLLRHLRERQATNTPRKPLADVVATPPRLRSVDESQATKQSEREASRANTIISLKFMVQTPLKSARRHDKATPPENI